MNRILFESHESLRELNLKDPRAIHVRTVLRAHPGDMVRIGVIDQRCGTTSIVSFTADSILFSAPQWDPPAPEQHRHLTVIVGHPRPLVLKRLMKDLSSLGVDRIAVFDAELGERSYGRSSLWDSMRSALVEGAAQGGACGLPQVDRYRSVTETLHCVSVDLAFVALARSDLTQAQTNELLTLREALTKTANQSFGTTVGIAVGSERGFSGREIEVFLTAGWLPVSLGPATLRTETATAAFATALSSI